MTVRVPGVKWLPWRHPLAAAMLGSVTGEAEVTNATLLGEPLPVELMNTVSVVDSATRDYLADDDGIAAWLRAVADRITGEGGNASAQPVRPLRELRDALRRL